LSDIWAKTTLKLYRGIGTVIYPFSGPFLRSRARKGKEDRDRRGERYGYASWERPAGPLVWLHAASVGESLAIMPLITRMESFGINLVLTTGTVTSASVAEERLSKRTIHQYVPLDMKQSVNRFLNHWKPDFAIFAESEIWPTMIQELSNRNVPQVLVNARMSDRSNRRWSKRPALAQAIFGKISQVIAQSDLDGGRFRMLGAPRVTVAGNLKVDAGVPNPEPSSLKALKAMIGNRPVWSALSTHKGEEAAIGKVHEMLQARFPDLLTIIVPRHPDRKEEVLNELQGAGHSVVTRSSGHPIGDKTNIFLGDTIGEMGLYLRLCDIAFMGKSLKSEGGQNPIEPAVTGSAILSGRYVQNFRETYQALLECGGAKLVRDEKMLASYVMNLLSNKQELDRMRKAAYKEVQGMTGALDKTITALDAYVIPLRVKAGLDRHSKADATTQQTDG